MKTNKGFTLVELLLVVLIIAVLASIVVPRITGASASAENAKDDANWANLIRALEAYSSQNSEKYPADQIAFDAGILNSNTYFPHGTPACPHDNSYVYVATSGEETVIKHDAGE